MYSHKRIIKCYCLQTSKVQASLCKYHIAQYFNSRKPWQIWQSYKLLSTNNFYSNWFTMQSSHSTNDFSVIMLLAAIHQSFLNNIIITFWQHKIFTNTYAYLRTCVYNSQLHNKLSTPYISLYIVYVCVCILMLGNEFWCIIIAG